MAPPPDQDQPSSPTSRRPQSSSSDSVLAAAPSSASESVMYANLALPSATGGGGGDGDGLASSSTSTAQGTHISVNPSGQGASSSTGQGERGGGGSGDGDGDGDSGTGVSDLFDGRSGDYPASMTSSVRQHVYEGGLRYHAYRDGKYAFPNDEVEQNRDDMKHAMTLMLMRGEHFYAPVGDRLRAGGGEVLDLGTGTGIWAIELADKFPHATISGVDLSPIQPNYVPDNVYFVVDDFEDEWVYPENHFDFIHIRHTIHSIRDRKTLLQRIYKHLKPGGHVEFQELHYFPKCDDASAAPGVPYAFRDFMGFLAAGLAALGSDLNSIVHLPQELRDAGFAAVTQQAHKCPVGVWPRDKRLRYCGLFLRTAIMDGLRGLVRRPFGTGLGWTQLQIEVFLVDVRKAVMDAGFHTYFPFHVVYGQKPVG